MKKLFILFFLINISIFSQSLGIGVILEDDSESSKNLLKTLEYELKESFLGTNFIPKVEEKFYLKNEKINSILNNINLDSKIDAVFILTSTPVDKINNLNKDKFYSVPFGFGKNYNKSPKNLNYIYSNLKLKKIQNMFNQIKGIKEGNIYISNITENNIKKIQKNMIEKDVKINILFSNKKSILESIEKKTPTFLIDFNQNLNKYSYSGLNLNRETSKRLRAASLNYLFYKTGKGSGNIQEVTEPFEDIYINSNVVSNVGLYPSLLFLQEISSINLKEEKRTDLSLKQAVDIALQSNLNLMESKENINTIFYNYKTTNSKRLPQLSANMDYSAIDDRSPAFKNGAPENSVNSFLQLSQVIFNDQLNSNIYIEKLAIDSSRKTYEQIKLNTIYFIASTYINILQLNSQLEIQNNNYKLLKETLDIARISYKVGAGGLQDVYRLESNVASAIGSIASVKGEITSQEIFLNNLLNLPESNRYRYQTLNEIKAYFALSNDVLKDSIFDTTRSEKIEKFLINESINNSNNLKQIDNSIKGKEREYKTTKRERYTPVLTAYGKYNKDNLVTPWGENSNRNFPDEYWEGGVSFELPLIKGGEIANNKNKIESQLKSLNYNKLSAQNDLTKEVLQTYTEILTNYTKAYTTQISVNASKKNLDIVKDQYAEGTINITDFLSAKNETLSQELSYTIEQFNLINSILKMENLYGRSSITMSKVEKTEIKKKLSNQLEN